MELYNLRRDPGEEYDVIKKYPNIANELEELAEKARSRGNWRSRTWSNSRIFWP